MRKLILAIWLITFASHTHALTQATTQTPNPAPSVVRIQTYDAEGKPGDAGSAFFVKPDVVLTRLELVAGASSARAFAPDDKKGYAVLGVVGVDRQADLVLLKLEGAVGKPMSLADPDWVNKGAQVRVLAVDENLHETTSPATLGEVISPFYELAGAIPASSYGGPVVNPDGEVVGVALMGASAPNTTLGANVQSAAALVANMKPVAPLTDFPEGWHLAPRILSDPLPDYLARMIIIDGLAPDRPVILEDLPPVETRGRRASRDGNRAPMTSSPPPTAVGASGPMPPPEVRKESVKEAAEKKNKDYDVVKIFYGTDRGRTGAKEPNEFYGAGRGRLETGTCEVSIPKAPYHQRGRLEAPSILRFEINEDPKRHVVLLAVNPLDAGEFNSQFHESLGAAKSKDVFVFVHGYNVNFKDAARRTAQLAYDLDFPGVPVLYSWPSQGATSAYTVDENEVEWTEPHLKQFLSELAAQAGGARIHLVAHSMGNRALTKVMRSLAAENATPLFSEVILTAPDIDAEVFERDLAPAIQKVARHITLYASSSDAALILSQKVNGYQRAGDSWPNILVVPGIDTIDASGIDTDLLGHSYFAQMKAVMDDIDMLLIAGKLPPERSLLEQMRGTGKYWRLPAAIVIQNGGRPVSPAAKSALIGYLLIASVFVVLLCAVSVWLILRRRRAGN